MVTRTRRIDEPSVMLRILLTDGSYKQTLSAIQHLPKDYHISVLTEGRRVQTPSFYSRYCNHVIVVPPCTTQEERLSSLLLCLKEGNYDILIPVGFKYSDVVSQYSAEIKKYVQVLAPEYSDFIIASHKDQTMDLARSIGVPIPATMKIVCGEDLTHLTDYPQVMKSSTGTGGFISYNYSQDELASVYKTLSPEEKTHVICQEYISGFGCGYFGVYNNGVELAYYMHKRLKEYPISGGPSVAAESYYDERLLAYGRALCTRLHWTGPIMCEFKYDEKHDDYKLIEINPKLWGSLSLTLNAGVNIPLYIIQCLSGMPVSFNNHYRFIQYHWLLNGELLHDYDYHTQNHGSAPIIPTAKCSVSDINFRDLLPTIYLIIFSVFQLIEHIHNSTVYEENDE